MGVPRARFERASGRERTGKACPFNSTNSLLFVGCSPPASEAGVHIS